MSGEKHVTIRSREYERLRQAETQLRAIQYDLPEVLAGIQRDTAVELQRRVAPLEQRQQAFAQEASKLHEQMAALLADQRRKTDLAHAWIEAADALSAFIDSHYRHQQFVPGRLHHQRDQIQQARDNLAQGAPEAAIGGAQQTYQALSDLRLELERLEAEWNVRRQAALDSARAVLAAVANSHRCPALDLAGKDTGVAVEVDWWSDGQLGALEKTTTELIAQIEDEQSPMNTAGLCAVVTQTVPELQQRLEHIVAEVRLRVLGSQLRVNIADLVVQALEEKGFAVQDGTYEGEDMRQGYAAKVTHLDGSEVVIHLTPMEGEPGKNDLRIHSYDADQLTDHELHQRMHEINQALRERGLEVGEPQAAAAQADPRLRDLARVRARQPLRPPATIA